MKAKFGFSSVLVDNKFNLFLCKIIVENPVVPPYFEHPGIIVTPFQKERTVRKHGDSWSVTVYGYTIRYCTLDFQEKLKMQNLIGLYLRKHAVDKIYQKWHWLHKTPEDAMATVIDQAGDALPADWAMSIDDNPYAMDA